MQRVIELIERDPNLTNVQLSANGKENGYKWAWKGSPRIILRDGVIR